MVKLHDVKFYKPDPRAIYCMSLQRAEHKLAIVRSDSCIEIWNLKHTPYIEKIIPSISDYNIQGVTWSNNRLFTCTLEGFLHEYDLITLTVKDSQTLVGEAAYCLDINKDNSNIAVGTENGYLNIFELTDENEIKFVKFLDKQQGRILCLKYDHTGKFIVTGSTDVIRVWDVGTGSAIHKMTTGRSELHKSTIVWCLAVMKDFTIVTGDSRGKLTFWDGKIGSQIESYQSHKGDILSLTLSEDEDMLFCGGVDPILISYVKVRIKEQNEKWVKSIQRKVHDHDVRALLLLNKKLYSGGIDGYLTCSYHPPKTIIRYPPIIQNNCITVSRSERMILLQYPNYLDVWNLGMTSEVPSENGFYQITNSIRKLLHLERLVRNDSKEKYRETIICSSLSPDGQWIVFSSISGCRSYKFIHSEEDKPQIKPVKNFPLESEACIRLNFTPDSKELIAVLVSGNIVIVNFDDSTIKQKIETSKYFRDVVLHSTISSNGKYLVVVDTESNIVVWSKHSKWKFYYTLPRYKCTPTALAIQPLTSNLWIAYSDHKIVEYSLPEKRFTEFSQTLDAKSVEKHVNKHFPIRNITFDLNNENVVVLHDDSNIVVINKNVKSIEPSSKKAKKFKANDGASNTNKPRVTSIKKYQHLIHLESLSEDEMVAVEVSPLSLMEKLPPCLKQNTFGTK